MGPYPYKLPSGSGLIEGTAISAESTIAEYKGGSLLGWNLYGKEKSKIKLYDNAKEAKGINYGIVSINKEESCRDWFGSNGLKFKTALWIEVIEGTVEGCIFVDIE